MGPGDKLKAFMQRFIGPKSQQAYRQVEHSISSKGDLRGVKKRKLMKGLTGDPVKDSEILYGPTPESKFNRPLTVEDQRPKKNGHPKITDDSKTYAEKLKKIQQSVLPTASDTARVTPTPKHNKILSKFEGPTKKGELVQYKRKDGSMVITTKRKAKKYKRKEERQEKKNKKVNTRQTPDAKF